MEKLQTHQVKTPPTLNGKHVTPKNNKFKKKSIESIIREEEKKKKEKARRRIC